MPVGSQARDQPPEPGLVGNSGSGFPVIARDQFHLAPDANLPGKYKPQNMEK
jgi:hypothetical protein